jgi:hypothetical protein
VTRTYDWSGVPKLAGSAGTFNIIVQALIVGSPSQTATFDLVLTYTAPTVAPTYVVTPNTGPPSFVKDLKDVSVAEGTSLLIALPALQDLDKGDTPTVSSI